MFSNLVITNQKLVVFIDDSDQLAYERYFGKFIENWLKEQGQELAIDFMPELNIPLEDCITRVQSIRCSGPINICLPSLAVLLFFQKPEVVFKSLNTLKNNPAIKQIFMLASTKLIVNQQSFVVAFVEHMADLIVKIKDQSSLSILSKKSGGAVTMKQYNYKISEKEILVELTKNLQIKSDENLVKSDIGTFKIELEEEEMIARKSMVMPYEKTSELAINEANIIYTPDSDDDFDDEDPDEDLYI